MAAFGDDGVPLVLLAEGALDHRPIILELLLQVPNYRARARAPSAVHAPLQSVPLGGQPLHHGALRRRRARRLALPLCAPARRLLSRLERRSCLVRALLRAARLGLRLRDHPLLGAKLLPLQPQPLLRVIERLLQPNPEPVRLLRHLFGRGQLRAHQLLLTLQHIARLLRPHPLRHQLGRHLFLLRELAKQFGVLVGKLVVRLCDFVHLGRERLRLILVLRQVVLRLQRRLLSATQPYESVLQPPVDIV
mmetsp:Transcript_34333/g.58806  ORF Transcript_34333/g.58806 Transcript_34333/m.58806 type:complete len:249 (-) Transcript_34333:309-1055(-)